MMTILMMVVMAVLAAARSMVDGIDDHDTERSVSCQRRGAALGGGGRGEISLVVVLYRKTKARVPPHTKIEQTRGTKARNTGNARNTYAWQKRQ